MILTSTGAAKAVGLVPGTEGQVWICRIRVPTPNVSVVDLVFEANPRHHGREINAAIKAAADGPLKGILGYTNEPLVLSDFQPRSRSSVFHGPDQGDGGQAWPHPDLGDKRMGVSNRMSTPRSPWADLIWPGTVNEIIKRRPAKVARFH